MSAEAVEAPVDGDAAQAAIEHTYDQGWSDGLPLVPATRPMVDRFLATTPRSPEEVLATLDHIGRSCTVELAAINAVMAGCRPEYFPVVLAAFEAIMGDRAATGGGWQSTSGPAPLLVVNGPVVERLGFNAAGGVFGPGFRANATVARAIGLIVRNAFGIHPHGLEQATQGVPGRWSQCIAENEAESPWSPLSADGGVEGHQSSVSAMLLRTVEFVDNRHTHDAEDLLRDLADTIGRSGSWIFRHANAALVLCPEHAQHLDAAGFDKPAIRRWLVEHSGRDSAHLARVGKTVPAGEHVRGEGPADDPAAFERHLTSDAVEHVPIVVAGARNAGISAVARLFTSWSGRAVPVVESEAAAARSSEEST